MPELSARPIIPGRMEVLVFMDIEQIDYSDELILVVDDEEPAAKSLEDLLKNRGFKAHHLGSGADAITELKKEKSYTFLIADIVMPGMDGIELMKIVADKYPDLCIIAMTGFTKEYDYVSVLNAGATDFINKPFSIQELEAKIRRGIIERDIKLELKRLSITDSLTGLYNQRQFYIRLKEEMVRAQRQKRHLALLLLDLDDFKQYNDTHGHLAGDEILQKFGIIINAQIRQGVDSGYRYGGDEFAVILNDASPAIYRSIGKRIKKAFDQECGMAASMGYASLLEGMTPEAFVAEADKHLYMFKEGKRKNNAIK
jgi:diguanylate cyclase (GGDEF)-like protein